MKFAGEHLQDSLANHHDSKYFFYSLLAVFCASYCGIYFLNLDQIPTVGISLAITLAIYWQFRLTGSLSFETLDSTVNNLRVGNRSITTITNSTVKPKALTQFLLQVYLWCGLSMRKNNRILTTNLARLPLQFFKHVRVSSGLMEKSIPWKIFYVNNSNDEFNNLIQHMVMMNFMDESHNMMIVTDNGYSGLNELFTTTVYDEVETADRISEYHSMGRPLTVYAYGLSIDQIRQLSEDTEMAVIPVSLVFEDTSLFVSIGSPVLTGNDIETYLQVETNRISKLRE